jgi:hypothetical protein
VKRMRLRRELVDARNGVMRNESDASSLQPASCDLIC